MILIAAFVIFRTHILHKKREEEKVKDMEEFDLSSKVIYTTEDIRNKNLKTQKKAASSIRKFLDDAINGLENENLLLLSKNHKKFKKFNDDVKELEGELSSVIAKLEDKDLEVGNYYTLNLYYLLEINNSLRHIIWDSFYHVDNNHKPLLAVQVEEMKEVFEKTLHIFDNFINRIAGNDFDDFEAMHNECVHILRKYRKNQIKRIQSKEVGTRNSMLFLGMVAHLRSMINFSKRLQVIETNYLEETSQPN